MASNLKSLQFYNLLVKFGPEGIWTEHKRRMLSQMEEQAGVLDAAHDGPVPDDSVVERALQAPPERSQAQEGTTKRPNRRLFHPSPSANTTDSPTSQRLSGATATSRAKDTASGRPAETAVAASGPAAHHPPASLAVARVAAPTAPPLTSGWPSSPGLRRAFIPKLYALDSWRPRLFNLLLPKYLLALDGECTAHLYRSVDPDAPFIFSN
jgi:hypothetical protein